MSKKTYAEPEVSIIAFAPIDIITTSTEPFDGEWVPIGRQSINEGFFPNE